MTQFKYVAVPFAAGTASGAASRAGEMVADSASDVRASLRAIGWQVVDLKQVRRTRAGTGILQHRLAAHLRRRRVTERSDFFDALATLIDSGVPILEAVTTINAATQSGSRARRRMLQTVASDLHAGNSLAASCRVHPGWFDDVDLAMLDAGQEQGNVAAVLRSLATRHATADVLTQKVIGVLTYPALVAVAGIGVVVFLSTRTLPQFAGMLDDAGVAVPRLTTIVMQTGQFIAAQWLVLLALTALTGLAALIAPALLARRGGDRVLEWLTPRFFRRLGAAKLAARLAELTRSGLPMDRALRIVAPTLGNPLLSAHVTRAADQVQSGTDLADAFDAPRWFDSEFCRLIDVGQASGELDTILDRVADRYMRAAERQLNRLTALLEPAVILLLAGFIGIVVVAAVLPLARLQEIL